MNEWAPKRLDQLGTVERGRSRHRPRNDPALYGGPYPFVQTGDIKAAGLRLYEFSQTYSEVGLAQSRLWPAGTLCFTIAANIGDTAILSIPACFPDSIVGFTADPALADTVFVKYSLDYAKQRFTSISRGATQDNLSVEKLLSQDLLIPPLETQRRVASILGAYDDLIEVNRRRIVILEEMARGLFEEWFVRFRFPDCEKAVAVETPDRRLPEGWRVTELGNILRLHYGKALKADTRIHGTVAVIGSSGVVGSHTSRLVDGPGIVVGRKGNVGSVIWSTGDFWPIDTAYFVETELPLTFAYQLLRRIPFQNTDAAVPGLNRDYAQSMRVVVPPTELAERYGAFAWPVRQHRDALEQANEKLAASRDLLLHRLISGQLSLEAAERQLEDVA